MAYTIDQYPTWKAEQASKYVQGSRVSWEDANKITWGYIANSLYKDGKVSVNGGTPVVVVPPQYSGWSLDPKFAFAWSSSEVYVAGQKVYYDIGDPKKGTSVEFLYIATPRYFGGHGKPNEELDEDEIRTWIPLFDPVRFGTRSQYALVPVRKEFELFNQESGGLYGEKSISMPETFNANASALTNAKEYAEFNDKAENYGTKVDSIFEGNPYDINVYSFYDEKRVKENGVERIIKTHRKKGIHYAELAKIQYDKDEEKKKNGIGYGGSWYAKNAKRQWFFTSYQSSYQIIYPFYYQTYVIYANESWSGYSMYGFSIEMWPTTPDDKIELIPHNHKATPSNIFGGQFYGKYPSLKIDGIGALMQGDDNEAPSPTTGTDKSGLKSKARIEVSSMAFWSRTITVRCIVRNHSWYWQTDENGNKEQKWKDPDYSFVNLDFVISDSSFNTNNKWYFEKELDWGSYQKSRTMTSISIGTGFFK